MADIQGNLNVIGQTASSNFIGPVRGVDNIQLNFAFGDVSPVNVFQAEANQLIEEIQILILETFNGIGAFLKVGDAIQDDRLFTANQNYPSVSATYVVTPNYSYGSLTQILLTIDPGSGATQGSGLLLVKYRI